MKIIIFSNIPSPYFVEYLNELGKLADVYAVFERRKASDRDSTWEIVNANNFKYSFLRGVNIGPESSLSFKIRRELRDNSDRTIIFANPTTLTGIIGINYCKRHKLKYCIQSEGGIPKTGKGFKEKIKRNLLSGAGLYLTGMKPESDYFYFYGAPLEKIKQYPFASLHEKDLISNPISHIEKSKIKIELGITHQRVVLYVGRMIECKGVDILLKAFSTMPDNAALYCVGGESTDEYKRIIKDMSNKNVFFVKHVNLEMLKKYYLSADIFVLPTLGDTWGLVVNEAMSFGLPIITTNMCVAGNQLIENGVNGYIVPAGSSEELAKCIYALLHDESIDRFAKANIEKISTYTYENMAKKIFSYLNS